MTDNNRVYIFDTTLRDGERGIDAPSLQVQAAQRGARALRGHHDHIHILGRNNPGAVVVGDAEAV